MAMSKLVASRSKHGSPAKFPAPEPLLALCFAASTTIILEHENFSQRQRKEIMVRVVSARQLWR
jgi:hypothetical protein